MKTILSIARYTLVENIRNKIFYLIILFGVVIIGVSVLLSNLGSSQATRILLDAGLAAIEFFALISAVFAAVTLILEEMESKTIYLILTRPVSRVHYLTGRVLGMLASVYCGMLAMAAVHLVILHFNGWAFTLRYPVALFLSAEKIAIMSAVATFFSLASTSAVTSIGFTVCFWILGHFSEEISFLSDKMPNIAAKLLLKTVYYIAPNFQYLNLKDFWGVPNITGVWIGAGALYGLLYSVLLLALSALYFKRKEF
jgi:ABC-type transport system involved in multi-copper enzyme maturation permease subunit